MPPVTTSIAQLVLPTQSGIHVIVPQDILRLEASSNYTYIYFTNRPALLTAHILGNYETLLQPFGFVRTHRSHLVNRQYISFIDQQGKVVMQDQSVAEISRRKKKQVLQHLREVA